MQSGVDEKQLHYTKWDHAIIGNCVDDRGETASQFAKDHCQEVHQLEYIPDSIDIIFDGIKP